MAKSRLVALAQTVKGVESVEVTRLGRLGPAGRPAAPDFFPVGPLEVARLDDDPNRREGGRLRLDVRVADDPHSDCGCGDNRPAVPAPTENPPNQDAVRRRIGTHGSFLAGLTAGLAGEPGVARLTARDPSDPAVAVLDAWATVADVLTFYQERFANEAYLRTATERRSVAELARLVGYRLRDGVSASVRWRLPSTRPTRRPDGHPGRDRGPEPAQAGGAPQTFETADPLAARTEWNLLPVRQTRPQVLTRAGLAAGGTIYLKGAATNLRPGDPLLIEFPTEEALFARAAGVEPDPVADRTKGCRRGLVQGYPESSPRPRSSTGCLPPGPNRRLTSGPGGPPRTPRSPRS